MAMIPVVIGTESFQEKVLTIKGKATVLRVAYGDPDQLKRVAKLMLWKRNLPEEDIHFMPPTTHNGKTQGAVLESQGVVIQGGDMHVVNTLQKDGEVNKEIHPSENDKVVESPDEVTERNVKEQSREETRVEVEQTVLGDGVDLTSELAEEDGVASDGRAGIDGNRIDNPQVEGSEPEGEPDLSVVEITEGTPRADLIAHTAQNPSLNTLRKLADTQSQGYQWKQGILLRHRLDELGDTYSQMCLPKKYRDKCMNLAHERFGHLR